MNTDIITIKDCVEAFEKRGFGVILENGQVTGFQGKKVKNVNADSQHS